MVDYQHRALAMTAPYKRLSVKHTSAFTVTTLWESDDHLLLVDSNRISESYRRFFYRDIQAFVVCETATGHITSGVLAGLALPLGLSAFFVGLNAGIVLGTLSGLLLLSALINFLRGPTCLCSVQTAVQNHRIKCLNRLRVARRVLGRLQPKIEAAQADKVS